MSDERKSTSFWLVLLVLGTLLLTGSVLGAFVPLLNCPNCIGSGISKAPEPRKFGQEWNGKWMDVTCPFCEGHRRVTGVRRFRYNPLKYHSFDD